MNEPTKLNVNTIYYGDCKDIMLKRIPSESVDLIYLDPPFFSNRNYESFWVKDAVKKTKLGFKDKDWGKVADKIDPKILQSYEEIEKLKAQLRMQIEERDKIEKQMKKENKKIDKEKEGIKERWQGGHNRDGVWVFIAYMRERINQCYRVLKPTGSLYLHCDWHASHYLKVMLDEIFDYKNFRNEIAWCYRGAGYPKRDFGKRHDNIFRYSKSDDYTFNLDAVREEYAPATKERFKHHIGNVRGKNDFGVQKLHPLGKQPDDWWQIQPIAPSSKERLGYPTQKPEALLERIIKASSNENDIVLDPFCGCGTTLAVAQKHKRKFVGIDNSLVACSVVKRRLHDTDVRIIGGETLEDYKKIEPHEFARFMIEDVMHGQVNPKKSNDLVIDGRVDMMTVPVQVKRWRTKVGRPEIDKFAHAVRRDNKNWGIIVGFDFSKNSHAEVARIKQVDNVTIELVKVEDLLKKEGFLDKN